MAQVKSGDKIKVHYHGKLTNGETFDSSAGREPLEFEVGSGMVIPGFDEGVTGMSVGEKKTINIPFAEAYGPKNPEMVIEMPKERFPADMEIEVGMPLGMSDQNGQQFQVTVVEIKDDVVMLDANHPLAGQDLIFDLELVEIVGGSAAYHHAVIKFFSFKVLSLVDNPCTMATLTKFEDIKAWQKARFFCNEVFRIIEETPLSKDYKLKEQINGSSGSIMDNIAEGFGRGGNLEFIQFMEISHASACESQSQLYRIADRKYISEEKFKELYDIVEEVKRMILALIKYLSTSPMTGPKYKWRQK